MWSRVLTTSLVILVLGLAAAGCALALADHLEVRPLSAIVTSQILVVVVVGIAIACRAEFDPPEDYGPADPRPYAQPGRR